MRALSVTLDAALRRNGLDARGRVGGDSLVVSVELPSPAFAQRALEGIRSGLLSAPIKHPPAGPLPTDPCGAVGGDKTTAELRAMVGRANVALSVVGSEQAAQALTEAYEASAEWPEGVGIEDAWPASDVYAAERQPHGQRLLVALRVAEERQALGAAQALGRPNSSLRWLVQAASPRWSLERVSATVRPRGACLLAEVQTPGLASTRSAARLASAVSAELSHALTVSPPKRVELLPLEAPRAGDAAARAAWAALSGRQEPPEGPRATMVWMSPAPDRSGFEREVRAAKGPKMTVETAVEAGQGRLWALLTSACPTAHEDAASAGHTATALATAAKFLVAADATALAKPWLSPHGLGLVASIPAHDKNAAARLGGLMGQALLAAASDVTLVSEARTARMEGAHTSSAWDLALRLGSDGHPSHLLPRGGSGSGDDFDLTSSRAALRGFVDGRLRLAVLANHGEAQAGQVAQRLGDLLVPLGPSSGTCPKPADAPTAGGDYLIDSDEGQALLIYPLAADQLASAQVAAVMLGGAGGWLEHSVVGPGLAQRAEAYVLGVPSQRAALVVALSDSAARLGPAVMQVRALLDRLRGTKVSKATLSQAVEVLATRHDLAEPAARLAALAEGKHPAPTATQLEQFFARELDETRLIVVRPTPPAITEP